ncbi:O-antigen ligase family protein [Deinococcus sp. HMF7604]|uniref:O-antigen ligase family protein n=1 Tax=Deinococcus betulae TaxID=2873312 RepID=UPI001CCBB87A|nr:O-antigen ligase family protein [Deinococcus betulae]MBZ9753161.1 O-antigen ligase family protein [Deinococcus betulae]
MKFNWVTVVCITLLFSLTGNEAVYGSAAVPFANVLGKLVPFLIMLTFLWRNRRSAIDPLALGAIYFLIYVLANRILTIVLGLETYGAAPWHMYLNFATCIMLYIAVSSHDRDQVKVLVEKIMQVLAVSGGLYGVVSLIGVLDGRFEGYPMRFLSLIPALYYSASYLVGQKARKTFFLFGAAVFPLITVLHKPAIISLAAGLGVVFLLSLLQKKYTFVVLGRGTAIATAIFISLQGLNYATGGKLFQQITSIVEYQFFHKRELEAGILDSPFEAFLGGRFDLWQTAWERIQSNPFRGYGFYQLSIERIGSYQSVVIPFHNGYLDLLLSVGILGVLFLLPILFASLVWLTALIRNGQAWERVFALGIAGALASLFFYNMGGTSILFYTINLAVWVLLGCLKVLGSTSARVSSSYD